MTYEEEFGPDEVDKNQLSIEESEVKWTIYQEEGIWKVLETSKGHLTFAEATEIVDKRNGILTNELNL